MKNITKKIKGFTLISVIIIIVALLIITILTIGYLATENGLIQKAKSATKKYTIEEAKEKLELAIIDLRIEQESKGEQLTKENLPQINNNEIDVRKTENFPIEVICEKYTFNVDENFNITYVGNLEGTIVTYTTEPEGYTNQDEIYILIKVQNEKGIKTIEPPKGDKIICNGKQTVGIDYTVTENGTYTFKIVDNENKIVEKEVVINRFDKLKPQEFIATISDITENGFTINADTKDEEADNENVKSGIIKYVYWINNDKYESTENTYTIDNLDSTKDYEIYVEAYDRAGNVRITEKISPIYYYWDRVKEKRYYILAQYANANYGTNNTSIKCYDGVEINASTGKISYIGMKYEYKISNNQAIGKWIYKNDTVTGQILSWPSSTKVYYKEYISREVVETENLESIKSFWKNKYTDGEVIKRYKIYKKIIKIHYSKKL